MSLLEQTLASLAPGVSLSRDLPGSFNPRHSLAIYVLPVPNGSLSAPGVVLGEALAARTGLGCTMLDGIPEKIPEGAVIVGLYDELHDHNPELLADIPTPDQPGQYILRIGRHATIVSRSVEGLANGMQTLSMIVLRHNQDTLPGSLVIDNPLCCHRGLAVEIQGGELGINLLMQILSFAATFKANQLQLILNDSYQPDREIPGLESFTESCRSYGIGVEIRVPWLARVLSGAIPMREAWARLRQCAERFDAGSVAFDDPLPANATDTAVRELVASLLAGEHGIPAFSADIALFFAAKTSPDDLRRAGITGWVRTASGTDLPAVESAVPVRIDVQANIPGFSRRASETYHAALDNALGWLKTRENKKISIAFRNVGVSHLWQNMLYPAATGLIAGWGNPRNADHCAWIFANLLYGDASALVMNMWNKVSEAFPDNLDDDGERIVRETAFGQWPKTPEAAAVLSNIDWLEVADGIHAAAESLKQTADSLARNTSTLTGAKLGLRALSWLHCFVALAPELERRARESDHSDGRTGTIAEELNDNFAAWYGYLENLLQESGLEIAELPLLEHMGQRIQTLCDATAG
jgi:hypothetical protein